MTKSNDYSNIRDHKAAQDVGVRAALGYYPVEFTMYGCAYLYQNKMYYKVSSEAEDIYSFIEKANLNRIYPSNVITETQKYTVPSGMRELISQDVKKELAEKMHKIFPKNFFIELQEVANWLREDTSSEYLWNKANQIESLYDREILEEFALFVKYFYSCCHLDEDNYAAITTWIVEERKNMDDDIVCKNIFEKTIYGFAYIINREIKFCSNAKKNYVYQKKYEAELNGYLVSPIIEKTYWYNRETKISNLFTMFELLLQEKFTFEFFEREKKLLTFSQKDKIIKVEQLFSEIKEKYNQECVETFKRYILRWGGCA